ncbi:ribulose-1,5-bisphosphate carboxylase/oxygenase activase protein [Salix suchowensis]|nr:ribulose-1,5-bisphosphate carboxylase/oxygenase activase protein [Salix suchowensis]
MDAVLAFDTSVTSKILPGERGVVDSLLQALTGTETHYTVMSSYEYFSTVGCWKGCTASERACPQRLRCLICEKL